MNELAQLHPAAQVAVIIAGAVVAIAYLVWLRSVTK